MRENRLGVTLVETDTVLTFNTVRQPDIYYFTVARIPSTPNEAIRIPPDLVAEVVSPGSRRTDREIKFKEYAEFGVAHYWIVDPIQRTIEAFALKAGSYQSIGRGRETETVRFDPFPDLAIRLDQIWWPYGGR